MDVIDRLAERGGEIRFLDPRDHVGFDVFDEGGDQPVKGEEGGREGRGVWEGRSVAGGVWEGE